MPKVSRFWMLLASVVLLGHISSCRNRRQPAEPVNPVPVQEKQEAIADSTGHVRQTESCQTFLQIASRFEGTPYRSGILEHSDGIERLVVDTSAFDCMTLVETSMALYRLDKLPLTERSSEQYRKFLTDVRYRNGVLTDYTSRLHYGSEWIADNIRMGYLKDITDSIAGLAESLLNVKGISRPLPLNVHLMTSFPQRYETLQKHPEFTVAMFGIEQQVNKLSLRYIPKDMVVSANPFLPEGCIVAITTNIDGLDIAHFGIVCHVDGQAHLLHASSSAKKVVVSKTPLYDYIDSVSHFTGVILLQVL